MLCLTRTTKNYQNTIRLTVGGEVVRVKLCRLTPGKASIGIDASRNVKVVREELLAPEADEAERIAASVKQI